MRLPFLHLLCPSARIPAQSAKANAATVTKYSMGATENDIAPRPVNCAGVELLVALAVVLVLSPPPVPPVPPALFPRSVKLAQVIRVTFPK